MPELRVFSHGIHVKFVPNFVRIGQLVQKFKHRKIYQIQYLLFLTRKGSRLKKDRTLGCRVFVQICSSPSAMTQNSTAAPVPEHTSCRGNGHHVHQLHQVARIIYLVQGLAPQRTHEFLHLGTTLMHSGGKRSTCCRQDGT
jgi:hypothetical protein